MSVLFTRALDYLCTITGARPHFAATQAADLPLVLRQRYQLYKGRLFDQPWQLAIEAPGWEPATPTEYKHHLSRLADDFPTLLVLSGVSATLRNRLVQQQIPFLVPNAQMYLPLTYIDLRENFKTNTQHTSPRPLSPTAQAIVLYQCLHGGLASATAQQLAKQFGCSKSMLTKVRAELEEHQLSQSQRDWKEARIMFLYRGRDLWDRVRAHLRTPIRRTHWITLRYDTLDPMPSAGLSALSQRSQIAAAPVPTFAMKERDFRQCLDAGRVHGCPHQDEADACVQGWSYDPRLLSQTNAVDPLSLYLSLMESPDERIQGELERMMETVPWQ